MQNFSYLCQIILKQTYKNMAKKKRFHRHFDTPGLLLYWKCGKCVKGCPTKIMKLGHGG